MTLVSFTTLAILTTQLLLEGVVIPCTIYLLLLCGICTVASFLDDTGPTIDDGLEFTDGFVPSIKPMFLSPSMSEPNIFVETVTSMEEEEEEEDKEPYKGKAEELFPKASSVPILSFPKDKLPKNDKTKKECKYIC